MGCGEYQVSRLFLHGTYPVSTAKRNDPQISAGSSRARSVAHGSERISRGQSSGVDRGVHLPGGCPRLFLFLSFILFELLLSS